MSFEMYNYLNKFFRKFSQDPAGYLEFSLRLLAQELDNKKISTGDFLKSKQKLSRQQYKLG